ncbi:MAG: hypothetical protein FJ242_01665 [Nitrospira sp.]|nr:hypothetical protein [Nitrospira sp.]
MGKKEFLRQIESLKRRIDEHEAMINREKDKYNPDEGLIKYWEKEILAFKNAIEKTQKRLRRGK